MNKNLHRVIFSAVRGVRVVVQETARSVGRATGGSAGAALSVAAVAGALMSAPLHAQIVADPNAPGSQRATILAAPNGVALVNIQTPSGAGVSRNVYRQFDVHGNGAILNNSRTNVQTQLGGFVAGNPWLATGSARVIVNEVNSANPSQLRGYVEVAGPRSEVIIANPAGIQVDGGGFINVNRATLTTGAAQYGGSGSLDSHVVRGGTVGISGAGLDASTTDALSILSRALELSGALHATGLTVVAGANQVTADLSGITPILPILPIADAGSKPAYAIDVAQLGGMYAHHIALVVNEQGVGAKNTGTIQTSAGSYTLAGAGKLTLSVDGMLENSGLIQTSSDADIRAGGLANSGSVQSAGSLAMAIQGDLANHIGSTGGTLEGQRVELSSAAGHIDNRGGTIRQTRAAGLTIAGLALSNTNGGVIGAQPVALSGSGSAGGSGSGSGGSGSSGSSGDPGTSPSGSSGSSDPSSPSNPSNPSGNATPSGSGTPPAVPASVALSPGALTAAGSLLNDAGHIYAGGDIALQTPSVDNAGGTLRVARMALSGPSFSNAGGTLDVSHTFSANVGTLDNAGGSLHAGRIAIQTAGDLDNRGGTLAGDASVDLSVAGALNNLGGAVAALDASSADLSIRAGSLANTGALRSARDATVAVAGAFSNQGSLSAGRHLTVTADSLDNTLGTLGSTLGGTSTVELHVGATNNDRGLIQSGGALTLDTRGQALVNTNAAGHSSGQGGIASGGTLALSAGATDNTAGFIGAKDALQATTGHFTNAAGGLVTGQADVTLTARGATYDNQGGKTQAVGHLGIDVGDGTVNNSGALIRSGGTTTVTAGAVDNTATLGTDPDLKPKTNPNPNPNPNTEADADQARGIEGRSVAITAATLNNDAGAIRADERASVTIARRVSNLHGLLSAGDTLAVVDPNRARPTDKALAVVNTGGVLTAGKRLALDAATFSADGTLTSGQDLAIALTQDLVNHASVSADRDLSYATTGRLTNHGKLLAGRVLTVSGEEVENAASGEMRGDTTLVRASSTLTNRGLIDGHDTRLDARTLVNAPTGRIYGDHLSIAAASVLNDADASSAATIAARDRLDIGAGSVTNRDGALIFSAGDLFIGGELDADRQATGTAASLHNQAATIEALGDVDIKARTLDNLNGGVTWAMRPQSRQVVEFAPVGSAQRWKADEVLIARTSFSHLGSFFGWTAVPGFAPDTRDDDAGTRLLIPSPAYPLAQFRTYYLSSPSRSSDSTYDSCTADDNNTCSTQLAPGAWYGVADPIWATFGVAAPARELPPDHALRLDRAATVGQLGVYGIAPESGKTVLLKEFDHPVTQAEIDEGAAYYLAHARLDVATERFIQVVIDSQLHHEYNAWNYTVTQSTPVLQSSNPARILSGGDMTLSVGSGTNDMSQILAGGALTARGGAVTNKPVEVQATTVTNGVALYAYIDKNDLKSDDRRYGITPYNPATPSTTVSLAAARMEGNQNATAPRSLDDAQSIRVEAGTAAAGAVRPTHRANPIVEVPSGTAGSLVVRTAIPDAVVPKASLFRTLPGPTSHYLVETDPAFANYRDWLGSDYLLSAMGCDPALVTKRLGDGFYEQRLLREQIAQLTGYRYLEGMSDDQGQYLALMDAGVTFAQAHHLTPGIALSAAQMAQLTSDIVWLVEQTVTLADGSVQSVLVPQVYVRVKPKDIDGSGALLSGDRVSIENAPGKGDLANSGTIAGRTLVAITADNVHNLGGRITGASVGVKAHDDLNNLGGTIDALAAVVLTAGRDIQIASTTQTAAGAQGSSTQLDRVAGVYVTNPGGTLLATAGRDVHLVGAILSNAGAGGVTSVKATHDIRLDTVKTSSSQDTSWDANNYVRTSQSAEVGSQIVTNGAIVLKADNDIRLRQATVSAEGTLAAIAGNDVSIESGSASQSLDTASARKSRGFLSSTSTTQRDSASQTTVVGSSLSGKNVVISAGHDLTVSGSRVTAQEQLSLSAKRDVRVQSAEETSSQSTDYTQSKSGVSASVLTGVSYDKSASAQNQTGQSTTQVGSTLSGGNVSIDAGRDAQIIASAVVADKDLAITAGRNIDVLAATDTERSSSASRNSQTRVGLVSGIAPRQTLYGSARGAEDSTGESRTAVTSLLSANGGKLTMVAGLDSQYKATGQGNVTTEGADLLAKEKVVLSGNAVNLNAATSSGDSTYHAQSRSVTLGAQLTGTVGSQATRAYDMAQSSSSTTDSRLKAAQQLKAGYDAYKLASSGALGAGIADAAAPGIQGDPSKAAFGVSVSVSSSKSRQDSAESFTKQRGTNIQAGSIEITARETDVTMQGAKLQARDIALEAQRNINLLAARNTAETHGSNSGSSAGVGVTAGIGSQNGVSFQLSASSSKGKANGSETTYDNTLITATDTLRLKSGGDTNLIGAQLAANQVKTHIAGNLNIESLQDHTEYESKQNSGGFDMSICVPPICYGQYVTANADYAKRSVGHNYQSAAGQSGIAAGSGGFDITVKGNTDLKGGAITSTASVDQNSFTTGSLTTSDLTNRQNTDSRSESVSVSYGSDWSSAAGNAAKSVTSTALSNLNSGKGLPADKNEASQTLSVISPATVKITGTGDAVVDAKSAENSAALTSRDAATANGALTNTLTLQQAQDIPRKLQQAQARQQAVQLVGSAIDNVIGDVSAKLGWEDGSAQKIALHGLAGIVQAKMGDASVAAGAAAGMLNEALLPLMAQYLESQGIHRYNADGLQNANFNELLTAGSTLLGAAAGAVGGNAGVGAVVANNATVNNYLKHAELVEKDVEVKSCTTDQCRTEVEAKWDAVSQDRNIQMQDSCITGGVQACRANIAEMQADLAGLANSGTGKGLNQYTPEESNNIKQLMEKYKTNLEQLASIGQAKEGTNYSSPAELAAKGYLTQQEAKDLQSFRAGTFIDIAGAIILPGGVKATGRGVPKGEVSNASIADKFTTAERATGGQLINVNPAELRWTQTTAGGNGRADAMRTSMAENRYDGPPIDVVKTPSGIVTIDHTRAAVALEQGITSIPAMLHLPTDILPSNMAGRFGSAMTWGEAAAYRSANQRPPLPADGTPTPPKLPAPKK